MSTSVRALFEAQQSLAFGSISGSYAAIGTAFPHPTRILLVVNGTAGIMQFSTDGINDHFVLPAGTSFVLDVSSNRSATTDELTFSKYLQLYVKQITAPTSGSVYVSAVYGRDD